jgi:hypothetical protein
MMDNMCGNTLLEYIQHITEIVTSDRDEGQAYGKLILQE